MTKDRVESAKNADGYHENSMNYLNILQIKYMQLVILADRKAGILLGVSFLMVSILLSRMVNEGMQLLLLFPMIFALTIITLAVFSLSPRVIHHSNAEANILFFNVVADYELEDYLQKMIHIMQSEKALHRSLLLDCYQTSLVLKEKYKYLRKCYSACLFACILAFAMLSFNLLSTLNVLYGTGHSFFGQIEQLI